MTTTGYASVDFEQWPAFSKAVLFCADVRRRLRGSTAGGLKVSRVLLLLKSIRRTVRKALHPRRVQSVRMDGHVIDEETSNNVNAYLAVYCVILLLSFVVISVDGYSIGTNISAVAACFNNVGPGLSWSAPPAITAITAISRSWCFRRICCSAASRSSRCSCFSAPIRGAASGKNIRIREPRYSAPPPVCRQCKDCTAAGSGAHYRGFCMPLAQGRPWGASAAAGGAYCAACSRHLPHGSAAPENPGEAACTGMPEGALQERTSA